MSSRRQHLSLGNEKAYRFWTHKYNLVDSLKHRRVSQQTEIDVTPEEQRDGRIWDGMPPGAGE